jgi:hypothetical protein
MKDKRKRAVGFFLGIFLILAFVGTVYLIAQPWMECQYLSDCVPWPYGCDTIEIIGCRLRCVTGGMIVCPKNW